MMMQIFGAVKYQLKKTPNSSVTVKELSDVKELISRKPSFGKFISELRLLLAKQLDEHWTKEKANRSLEGRPLFLHFDEAGGLDQAGLMENLKCEEPRDVFYAFWTVLDNVLKKSGCFVYVSGKDTSMDPGASCLKFSGFVERILLEPLLATHVMQMLSRPQSPDTNGLTLCRAVFRIHESTLLVPESTEVKLLEKLANLLVEITGGLPRALKYSFMWLKENAGSLTLLKDFLADRGKVRYRRSSFVSPFEI